MPINLDFGEVGKIPEEGTYLVKCKTAELKKGPQAWYIKCQFEILGPTMPGYSNLYLNLSFAPQSLWATQRDLEALTGYEYREDNMNIDEADLPGLTCGAIILHGEFDGRAKPEIDKLVSEAIGTEAMMNYKEPEEMSSPAAGFSWGQKEAETVDPEDVRENDEEPF